MNTSGTPALPTSVAQRLLATTLTSTGDERRDIWQLRRGAVRNLRLWRDLPPSKGGRGMEHETLPHRDRPLSLAEAKSCLSHFAHMEVRFTRIHTEYSDLGLAAAGIMSDTTTSILISVEGCHERS
jgi:hypothetical protein